MNRIIQSLLLVSGLAMAQSLRAQERPASVSEEVEIRVAGVAAIVEDGSGRPIRSLRQKDFRLEIDGEVVALSNFTAPRELNGQGLPVTDEVILLIDAAILEDFAEDTKLRRTGVLFGEIGALASQIIKACDTCAVGIAVHGTWVELRVPPTRDLKSVVTALRRLRSPMYRTASRWKHRLNTAGDEYRPAMEAMHARRLARGVRMMIRYAVQTRRPTHLILLTQRFGESVIGDPTIIAARPAAKGLGPVSSLDPLSTIAREAVMARVSISAWIPPRMRVEAGTVGALQRIADATGGVLVNGRTLSGGTPRLQTPIVDAYSLGFRTSKPPGSTLRVSLTVPGNRAVVVRTVPEIHLLDDQEIQARFGGVDTPIRFEASLCCEKSGGMESVEIAVHAEDLGQVEQDSGAIARVAVHITTSENAEVYRTEHTLDPRRGDRVTIRTPIPAKDVSTATIAVEDLLRGNVTVRTFILRQ